MVQVKRTFRSSGSSKRTRCGVCHVDESLVMDMISYAGHDSAETAHVVPTAMIFVPSKGEISHNPAEFTGEEDW